MYSERSFKNEEPIKDWIIEGYRSGVNDTDGKPLRPGQIRGGAFKGTKVSDAYRKNYATAFGHE